MKEITKTDFYSALNNSKYGLEYLELVNNPTNNLSNKQKGENHHIHLRALGGADTNENIVRLSIFNHCLAHLLLVKAVLELDVYWKYEPIYALMRIANGHQFNELSDAEKITLEEVHNWAYLREQAYIEHGKKHTSIMKNVWADEVFHNRMKEKCIEVQNRPGAREHQREVQLIAQNRPETKAKRISSLRYTCNLPEIRKMKSELSLENQNRPEVKEKKSKSLKGKNKGKHRVYRADGTFYMSF